MENSAGQPDINYTGTVTIALANNPGGDTLKGTLTVPASQGVAIFSGLTLEVADSGYTINSDRDRFIVDDDQRFQCHGGSHSACGHVSAPRQCPGRHDIQHHGERGGRTEQC